MPLPEAWWRDADENPGAYRDVASVASLIAGALDPAEESRPEHRGLVIEALGRCDPAYWTDEIERLLVTQLDVEECAPSAARAFAGVAARGHAPHADTLAALERAACRSVGSVGEEVALALAWCRR